MSRWPDHSDRLEDVRWMAETGESLDGAARRLGISSEALEKWLERHDRDSLAALYKHQPRDHNRALADVSIAELTGLSERIRARKSRQKEAA